MSSVSMLEGCISRSSHAEMMDFVLDRMDDTGNLISTLIAVDGAKFVVASSAGFFWIRFLEGAVYWCTAVLLC